MEVATDETDMMRRKRSEGGVELATAAVAGDTREATNQSAARSD